MTIFSSNIFVFFQNCVIFLTRKNIKHWEVYKMLIQMRENVLGRMPKTEEELRMAITEILSDYQHEMRTAVLGPIFCLDHDQHENNLSRIEEMSTTLSRRGWVVFDIASLVNCLEIMLQNEDELEAAQRINDFIFELIISGPPCFDMLYFQSNTQKDILASILTGAANKSGIEVIYFD